MHMPNNTNHRCGETKQKSKLKQKVNIKKSCPIKTKKPTQVPIKPKQHQTSTRTQINPSKKPNITQKRSPNKPNSILDLT